MCDMCRALGDAEAIANEGNDSNVNNFEVSTW